MWLNKNVAIIIVIFQLLNINIEKLDMFHLYQVSLCPFILRSKV